MKKAFPILVVVLVVAGMVYWLARNDRPVENELRISGNIEITEVDIAFKGPGKIQELLVKEGDRVQAGDVVARLDVEQLNRQLERAQAAVAAAEARLSQTRAAIRYATENVAGAVAQREAELRAAEAQLEAAQTGSRAQEIQQAQAAVEQAESELDLANSELERGQALIANDDISAQELDRLKTRAKAAEATLRQVRETYALVREGPRKEVIASAKAQVERAEAAVRSAQAGSLDVERLRTELGSRSAEIEQARAEVAFIQTQLSDAVAISPVSGVVLTKSADQGEVIPAGATIVTIGDLARPWLRGYINQIYQGRVQVGSEVEVTTDSFPGKVYKGRLSFLASEAEFTPKQIQTEEERVKLVYRVKIDLDNPNQELKRNMPADAVIPLLRAGGDARAEARTR